LDLPGLEPHAAPLSYVQAGATVSESLDSNVDGAIGGSSFRSISRGLGRLTLQRVWSNYDLAVDYVGGVGYYNARALGWKLIQQMDLAQKITWKRGQLTIRDEFRYLPEGNFGEAYGSVGSLNQIGSSQFGGFWGGTNFGALGQVSRIANLSLAEISQNLTPKSAITATVGYAFTHFTGNDPFTGTSFLGSSQLSAQVGYNRIFTRHDQVALVYGYQGFDFSATLTPTAFHSHVIQVMYGHRISGRMDFLIGAGPQITLLNAFAPATSSTTNTKIPPCVPVAAVLECPTADTRLGVAGRAQLRYRFPKTMLELSYNRYETSGSGIFAGAQSDIGRLRISRPITRVWSGFADLGVAHNSRLQPVFGGGIDANTYTYGYAGVGLHRRFGREWNAFGSYQFNELSFDSSFCAALGLATCSRISQRHVITVGLDWTPRPIRID
jgi:hypothetical protein